MKNNKETSKNVNKNTMNKVNNNSDILQDPRFAHLIKDPRFKAVSTKTKKIKIDKRFQSMFHSDSFKVLKTVDKYGRKINNSTADSLKKYYDLNTSDEDDSEVEDDVEDTQSNENDDSEEDSAINDESEESDQSFPKLNSDDEDNELEPDKKPIVSKELLTQSDIDYARGEGKLMTDSSSDEESEEEELNEIEADDLWNELIKDVETTEDSSNRIAVCNMDWDRIRAVDIMVLCNSFLPRGGSIISVTIYPSDFGKARMALEEVKGPAELMSLKPSEPKNAEGSDNEIDGETDEAEFNREKLREYQLNRLKYYYAVIVFDSIRTADVIYKECEGIEYESSSNKLDLRFIPDDVEFDDSEIKDCCTELPASKKYAPRLFATSALQNAKVNLTWDETDLSRQEMSDKLFSNKMNDISDADLRNYVACSTDEEEEEEEITNDEIIIAEQEKHKKKTGKGKNSLNKYKELLSEISEKEKKKKNEKIEREYSWGIDVEKKIEDKAAKTQSNVSNPFDMYLEKQKEKKKLKKELKKKRKRGALSEDENESSENEDLPDGVDLNDPYFAEEFSDTEFAKIKKKTSPKKKAQNQEDVNDSEDEERKKRDMEYLELLLEDGEDKKSHFNYEKIVETGDNEEPKSKRKRRKMSRTRKQIELAKNNKNVDDFKVNLDDNRFVAIYNKPEFNIDPTNPNFKKTKGMEAIVREKFNKRIPKDVESVKTSEKSLTQFEKVVKNLKSKIHKSEKNKK